MLFLVGILVLGAIFALESLKPDAPKLVSQGMLDLSGLLSSIRVAYHSE